jgi:hypothetical protein
MAAMKPLAWACAAVAIAATLGAAVIAVGAARPLGDSVSIATVFALCFPVMGALVIRRQGSHPVGWLMIFIGTSVALHTLVDNWSRAALVWEPGSLPAGAFLSWVAIWLWLPGWIFATTLLPVLLPDGRPQGRRRLLAWVIVVTIIVITLVNAIFGWPLRGFPDIPANPDPELGAAFDRINALWVAELPIFLTLTALSLGSLVRRYRRERDVRVAWVIYGATLAVIFSLLGAIPALGNFIQVLEAVALVGGIAIAMFRHNLYDIGAVVNRTLVYGGLTAVLAGAYLLGVLLLQLLLSPSSDLAIAGSTLAVAALFTPVRNRVQAFVDRRFYRRKYDAARTLETFSARLRNEVSLDALDSELRAVVAETVQPAHVSLWLKR